jgi:hypothetical protein
MASFEEVTCGEMNGLRQKGIGGLGERARGYGGESRWRVVLLLFLLLLITIPSRDLVLSRSRYGFSYTPNLVRGIEDGGEGVIVMSPASVMVSHVTGIMVENHMISASFGLLVTFGFLLLYLFLSLQRMIHGKSTGGYGSTG